jgi:hypothetical protein
MFISGKLDQSQGCQMVYFQTKTSQFGQVFEGLGIEKFGRFYIWPFGNFMAIWYIFPRFGISGQEKSGNPDQSQGDQIRKIFVYWAIVNLLQVFEIYRSRPNFGILFSAIKVLN